MRIAALVLIVLSGLACAWLGGVAAGLIVPASDEVFFAGAAHVPAARSGLLLVCLALANAAGVVLLEKWRRPGALWLVLFAGFLALAVAIWHVQASSATLGAAATGRVPDYAEGYGAVEQGRAWLRWLLAWAALGFSVVGWAAWAVCRRIEIGHGRD